MVESYKLKKILSGRSSVQHITSHASLRLFTVIARKFYLPCRLILLTATDMKCVVVFILVSIASLSQTFAVLRPLFPAKPAPPFSGEVISTGDDSIRYSAGKPPTTVPR